MFSYYNNLDILLNVFLAIAVDNLGDAEDMDEIEKEKEVWELGHRAFWF